MIKPEPATFQLALRPPFRPKALRISPRNGVVAVLALLAIVGIVAYVIRLTSWGDRPAWTYPAVVLMYILSTAAAAPLVAFATRMARGYWGLPARRVAELFAIPSLISFALLIPVLATLPPFTQDGVTRANLWFGFAGGAPFLTDALAVSILLLLGAAILWASAVPDLAGPPGRVRAFPTWKRILYLNWMGTKRQWIVMRGGLRVMSAFYLMMFVFVHMVLTTDLGQSLLPGWRSGIFPAYHVVSSIQGTVAIIVITLYLLRRFSPSAGRFIGDEQAAGFGKLLLALTLFWFYFFWSDFLLVWYARIPSEVTAMQVTVALTYKIPFLIAITGMLVIPFVTLIFNPIRRKLSRLALVASFVLVGLVFDRIRLFVPAMGNDDPFAHRLAELPSPIFPDTVDVLFIIGVLALVVLCYLWAATRIPILSGWEMREASMYRYEDQFLQAHVLVVGKPN